MTDHYSIIKDPDALNKFIQWLPELRENEIFYVALFARKKYCADIKNIKTDKAQCKRFTAKTNRLQEKILQLECPLGSYSIKDITIPQEALALYISVNPRDMYAATKNGLIKFATLMTQEYNGYNPHQEIMSEIHRACSRKVWFDFDFDGVELEPTLAGISKALNIDCVRVLKTHSGFHVLVNLKHIRDEFSKSWYQEMHKLPGIDVRGDNLIPVPGCVKVDLCRTLSTCESKTACSEEQAACPSSGMMFKPKSEGSGRIGRYRSDPSRSICEVATKANNRAEALEVSTRRFRLS